MVLDVMTPKINIADLAEQYCKENDIVLVDGEAYNEEKGLEITLGLEESGGLTLTRFYNPKDLLDGEHVYVFKEKGFVLTRVDYVALSNERFFKKFKEKPSVAGEDPYAFFLERMKKRVEEIEENHLEGKGMILNYKTDASQEDLKRIVDDLIRPYAT